MGSARIRPRVAGVSRCGGGTRPALYFGCRDVDDAYRYLREKGIELDAPTVAHYGMRQLYLKDPDGFTICFQWKS